MMFPPMTSLVPGVLAALAGLGAGPVLARFIVRTCDAMKMEYLDWDQGVLAFPGVRVWGQSVVTAGCSMTAFLAGWRFGWDWMAVWAILFSWGLLVLVFIDLETLFLPDRLTLPLLWAGLLVNSIHGFIDLRSAVWGAAAGYLVLWGIYWLFRLVARREGMGFGDFKLLAALGGWMGWQSLPLMLLGASVAGLLVGGFWVRRGRGTARTPFPFGPFLALAGYGVMLCRQGGWGL